MSSIKQEVEVIDVYGNPTIKYHTHAHDPETGHCVRDKLVEETRDGSVSIYVPTDSVELSVAEARELINHIEAAIVVASRFDDLTETDDAR